MTEAITLVPGTRGYKPAISKQSKRSSSTWLAAMSAEQKQIILDRLKKHRDMQKHECFFFSEHTKL